MNKRPVQTESSIQKNSSFFRDNIDSYSHNVGALDSYLAIKAGVNESVSGIARLLDIGNGGVFDYDTNLVGEVVALDLFLEHLPASYQPPPRVTLKTGSALDIPEPSESFDGVLMVMLIHHLIGKTVGECLDNVRRAISEAYRVLAPGGRSAIVESCVPRWFYAFERLVFRPASLLIEAVLPHPATLQYPPSVLADMLKELPGAAVEISAVQIGRWLLQFGYRVPAVFTPARPYRFIVRKQSSH